jgi:hypothetical protein
VIEDQKIVVGEPPLQNVQGNHEQRKQQVNLPLFNFKMTTTRMTCKSLKRGSEKLFPLFPFLNLFYLLFIFLFYEMQK